MRVGRKPGPQGKGYIVLHVLKEVVGIIPENDAKRGSIVAAVGHDILDPLAQMFFSAQKHMWRFPNMGLQP